MSPNTLSDVSESGQCELSVVVLQFLSGGLHPGIVRSGAPYPTVPARSDATCSPTFPDQYFNNHYLFSSNVLTQDHCTVPHMYFPDGSHLSASPPPVISPSLR